MIRWGIIGAGNIAKRFAASLKKEQDTELYAISGRKEEKLKQFQSEFGCEKIYVGHENLLADPAVDAVYIALPHHMHKEWSIRALKTHKAVMCEKPAVLNESEMQEIAAAAREENTLFMEAMKCRFEPAYIRLKEILNAGSLGEIRSVYAENCFLFPKERAGMTYHTIPHGGGALLDSGCYCASWLSDFMSGEPKLKKAYANVINDVDWYVDAKLSFANGEGEIVCAFDRKTDPRAVIECTEGRIEIERPHRPDLFRVVENGKEEAVYEIPYENDDFTAQIRHFHQLMKEGRSQSDIMSLEDSIRNAHILDLIRTGFTGYDEADLKILELQEQSFMTDCFISQDALSIGMKIIELQKEYDRGIAVRIVRHSDGLILFQHVMDDKNERNLMYAEGKYNAIKEYGHSSAWVNIASKIPGFVLKEGVLPSGGSFPICYKDGTAAAAILVSGLHEGKDHELIVRALSAVTGKAYPDFIKAIG